MLFERGCFAEMAADEGYPAARERDGVTLIRDMSCREGDESKDRASHLLDVVTPSRASAALRPMVVFAQGGGPNAGAKDDETQVETNLAIALAQHGDLVRTSVTDWFRTCVPSDAAAVAVFSATH